MYISPIINSTIYSRNRLFENKSKPQFLMENEKVFEFPKGLSSVNFVGYARIPEPRMIQLMKEYKWFINANGTPPIKSLLQLKTTPEELDAFTRKLLSHTHLSNELIHSIVDQKRSAKYFVQAFNERLPYDSDIFLSFMPNNIYRNAYTKYIESRVQNASSISELLEIRPDWREDFLLKKHQELYNDSDFELGIVPDEIGKENFKKIILYLRQYQENKSLKDEKYIPDLILGDKTFQFYYFTDGRTSKNVFGAKCQHGHNYVIKLSELSEKALDEVYALGTLCKIDTYLTRNYCRNSAPIKYYNHGLNASIYDFIEHKKLSKQPSVPEIEQNIPDFIDLGLRYYDNRGVNNFFIMDNSQNRVKYMNDFHYGVSKAEWITVDNDGVSFDCKFHPVLDKYHKELPMHTDFFNVNNGFM